MKNPLQHIVDELKDKDQEYKNKYPLGKNHWVDKEEIDLRNEFIKTKQEEFKKFCENYGSSK